MLIRAQIGDFLPALVIFFTMFPSADYSKALSIFLWQYFPLPPVFTPNEDELPVRWNRLSSLPILAIQPHLSEGMTSILGKGI